MISDKVDDNMPLIGIPAFIKPADPDTPQSTLYFVSIRPCSAVPAEPEGEAAAEDKAAFTKMHTTMTTSQPSVGVCQSNCVQLWMRVIP